MISLRFSIKRSITNPGNKLDELGLELEHSLPASIPERVAREDPVLRVRDLNLDISVNSCMKHLKLTSGPKWVKKPGVGGEEGVTAMQRSTHQVKRVPCTASCLEQPDMQHLRLRL